MCYIYTIYIVKLRRILYLLFPLYQSWHRPLYRATEDRQSQHAGKAYCPLHGRTRTRVWKRSCGVRSIKSLELYSRFCSSSLSCCTGPYYWWNHPRIWGVPEITFLDSVKNRMGQNPKMKLQLYRYNGTRLKHCNTNMYANYPITTTTISITQASTTQNTKYGVYSYLL